ncbi:SDR family oxidoreductase [Caldimonas thermodepolymerans]|uniref:SDR family oxidoreductase n=1 Tax=Caldimonas thermodepolymerans TaxID=215580 RepID=UPI002235842B|nr:SDR family oxidoreductase [Caldimonas thermodepolymerans]UZG46037.1 SDR family oxidoreductase [Caldimonas thermodepolymerans]
MVDVANAELTLRGRVAVITGASSGIGEAIARELAAVGMRLVITARRTDLLEALSNSLTTPCATLAADITDPATPGALLTLALRAHGRADVLINNAGRMVAGPLETVNLDDLAEMTRVNFDAAVRASYVFARHFKAQGSGAIINVSSVAAYLSHSSMGVYGALKHALEVFSTALRVELRGSGVRVGTIAPGSTDTEMFSQIRQRATSAGISLPTPLAPADIAKGVRMMLECPSTANIARLLLVSAEESA